MLDFVPSIRKLPNTRYCCRNLEFFPNPNISNIRQLFSAENTAENVFVVTLIFTYTPFNSALRKVRSTHLSPSFETDRCHLGEVSTDDDGKIGPHVYNFNLKEPRDSIHEIFLHM